MKKLILLFVASLLLTQLLVAFPTQAATPFNSPLPPALTETSSVKVPANIYVFADCALGGQGEEIYLAGNLHIVSHTTLDPNGGYHSTLSFQPQGISGVGSTSGDKYQATGITRYSDNYLNLPYTTTYVNNFRIIGQGPGNNYLVHETYHITINANGELTAFVDNWSIDCK